MVAWFLAGEVEVQTVHSAIGRSRRRGGRSAVVKWNMGFVEGRLCQCVAVVKSMRCGDVVELMVRRSLEREVAAEGVCKDRAGQARTIDRQARQESERHKAVPVNMLLELWCRK